MDTVLCKILDPYVQNDDNVCPIHGAATSGKVDVIIDLIEKHGVNPRCKTMNVCMIMHMYIHIRS